MDHNAERPRRPADPRDYFAAERTLLAWVRTGLAMMGFGFVVARFGLFLREVGALRDEPARHGPGVSLWFGTTLVILGVVVEVAATVRHWRVVRRLDRGRPLRFGPWSLATIVALLLAVLGLVMAAFLSVGLEH